MIWYIQTWIRPGKWDTDSLGFSDKTGHSIQARRADLIRVNKKKRTYFSAQEDNWVKLNESKKLDK